MPHISNDNESTTTETNNSDDGNYAFLANLYRNLLTHSLNKSHLIPHKFRHLERSSLELTNNIYIQRNTTAAEHHHGKI